MNIRPIDIKVQDEFMTLHLPCSKTNQLRKGDELVIARTRNAACPVAMLELYMWRTHTAWDDQRLLFRPICKSSKGERLRESGCISYSCLRDLFKRKLEALGEKSGDYGYTACGQAGQLQLLIWKWRTASSSAMVVGGPRMLKTAMLRIPWSRG